jgi:transposase
MKDGRTHLAHKAEHAVDLETGAVVAVTVQPADRGDTQSLEATLKETLENLAVVVDHVELPEQVLTEVVADRGYHSAAVLARTHELGLRSYIAEPKRPRRRWRGRKAEQKATYANRRRMRGFPPPAAFGAPLCGSPNPSATEQLCFPTCSTPGACA